MSDDRKLVVGGNSMLVYDHGTYWSPYCCEDGSRAIGVAKSVADRGWRMDICMDEDDDPTVRVIRYCPFCGSDLKDSLPPVAAWTQA